MIRKKSLLLFLIFTLVLSLAGCGGTEKPATQEKNVGTEVDKNAEDKEVTLSVTSAWAEGNTLLFNMQDFMDKVAEKTNGTVKIVWGGGPEAVPTYQLVEALRNGVVDIAWTAHTYNVSYVPVMEAMKLTDAEKIRETGGFDFINELYKEKLNSHYIAATTNGLTYNLYTKQEIKTIDDFNGMTIRATPAYQAFVEGLGAGVVNTAPGEAYQALERNVIQGYGWPSVGVKDFGWQEVSKYIVQPAFYNVDVAIMMSDKAWNKLSRNQQNAIMEAGLEIESEANEYYVKAIAEENKILKDEGMIELNLPTNVADEYYKLAYDKGWESALKVDPENASKLQEFAK